jgi:hypothetical protein
MMADLEKVLPYLSGAPSSRSLPTSLHHSLAIRRSPKALKRHPRADRPRQDPSPRHDGGQPQVEQLGALSLLLQVAASGPAARHATGPMLGGIGPAVLRSVKVDARTGALDATWMTDIGPSAPVASDTAWTARANLGLQRSAASSIRRIPLA